MASQDMPPPGGYATINVERTYPKPLIRQGIWFAIVVGLTINGYRYIKNWKKKDIAMRTEVTEHFIAVSPFIKAEQEKRFLKHLSDLREREREIMKDHPNWKLGTLYGEPLYKTLPEDTLPPIPPDVFTTFNAPTQWMEERQVPDLTK